MVSPQSSLLHQHGEKRKMMGVDQGLRKRIRIDEKRNIHDLPNDLLRDILGRLDFRDAATTSLLSSRLLDVWTSSTRLDFEDDTDCQYQSGNNFMKFVNFVMSKHHGSRVDFLKIAFNTVGLEDDDDQVQVNLDTWVDFARSKCVRSLEFDLNRTARGLKSSQLSPYGFPLHVFYPCLSSLTSLSLKSISISDDDIVYLLERCAVNLETLVVENAPHLKNVKISAQKLKHLKIRYCHNLLSIDLISVPNLESFEKAADYIDVVRVSFCGNVVPKLSNVTLRGILCQNVVFELQKYAPCLEKLELDMELLPLKDESHSECCLRFPRNFPRLGNLKQLVLKMDTVNNDFVGCCFMDLMFIILACPLLQNLTFKYQAIKVDGNLHTLWDSSKRSYTLSSLKTVEFIGWWGLKYEVDFANHLVDIATNLEKVSFDPNDQHRMDPLWCAPHPPIEKEEGDLKAAILSAKRFVDSNSGLVACEIVSPAYEELAHYWHWQ